MSDYKPLGFTMKEYNGSPIAKFGSDGLIDETLLSNFEDIKLGYEILVPGLFGGWIKMIVQQDVSSLYAKNEGMMACLEFSKDDRQCWVCVGLINTQSLKRLKKSTNE